MEWKKVNTLPSHSSFPSLGVSSDDGYLVSNDCLSNLEDILNKLCTEDRTLRTFRKALGFFQVVKKDLLPLLVYVKNDHKITAATIRILFNLTIPVECLLPIEEMAKTDIGFHTVSELNHILNAAKEAFLDPRSTKAVVGYIKQVLEKDMTTLVVSDCENVNNCLLLIRNILHTPESRTNNANPPQINNNNNISNNNPNNNTNTTTNNINLNDNIININNNGNSNNMQNQVIWNLFSQGIDKILITLMTCPQKSYWGVTMVQLIALMYKDQHVTTMKKLLNLWFEASLSESSEDNESNTSPPDQGSGDSSPMLTSDPTSDSSDTGSSSKNNRMLTHCVSMMEIDTSSKQMNLVSQMEMLRSVAFIHINRHHSHPDIGKTGIKASNNDSQRKGSSSNGSSRRGSGCKSDVDSGISSQKSNFNGSPGHQATFHRHSDSRGGEKRGYPSSSEVSDCGYVTQHENPEQSVSTSSNEDDGPQNKRNTKPVHQKPHNIMQKTRYTVKPNILLQDKKEWRKKKLSKRSRATNFSINMKALIHYTPSDEDISNLLKEFTVEFLLKGYGSLVQELHTQLLNNGQRAQIDTSHFFWLVTYFLKFAAQLELELDLIKPVLSFEILSYLTYEGVDLFEQLELATRQERSGLMPCLRRMHLVVTAIRELIQAIETYKKITHLSSEDRGYLLQLQLQIGSTEDLKCLFVLLLHQYNPNVQSKQYLQDLIITNHMLLLCLDSVSKLPEFKGTNNMVEHIKQFATVEVMCQYGILLEDFQENGEYINNCIFTMMHHISGDLEEPAVLFQPSILKTFSEIWEMDFEICDDWSDLIEYVMHKFINILRPNPLLPHVSAAIQQAEPSAVSLIKHIEPLDSGWPAQCCSDLYWYYVQSAQCSDTVGAVQDLYAENSNINLSRMMIIKQLLTQHVIDRGQYDSLLRLENPNANEESQTTLSHEEDCGQNVENTTGNLPVTIQTKSFPNTSPGLVESSFDTVSTLRDHLIKEKKSKSIKWLQDLLLEACYVKLNIHDNCIQSKLNAVIMEPIPLHYTLMKQSIPIVPWNSEQRSVMSYQPFIMLLHKLGFHLPADSGKIFVRIPHFWTSEMLLVIAEKLGPIANSWSKFDANSVPRRKDITKEPHIENTTQNNEFAVQRFHPPTSIIRFTPLPNSSPAWIHFAIGSETPTTSTVTMPSVSLTSAPPRLTLTTGHEDASPSETNHADLIPDKIHRLNVCNVCETGHESVASDLTHMCISDEEAGIHLSNNGIDFT